MTRTLVTYKKKLGQGNGTVGKAIGMQSLRSELGSMELTPNSQIGMAAHL